MTDSETPSAFRFATEARVGAEWAAGLVARFAIARHHDGRGRKVLVIPGFMAFDWMTGALRHTLQLAGYKAEGWSQLGQNLGLRKGLMEQMEERLLAFAGEDQIALVGWSLGGIYARELAKRHPGKVERVITMGSPFSGDPHANNAWVLYEKLNDHPVDHPPIETNVAQKPPVLTIALWSPTDGLVAPASARGLPHESDKQVLVNCSHMGFKCAPAALSAVLKALD